MPTIKGYYHPTKKQVSLYNQLIKKQNKIRTEVLKRRGETEEEAKTGRLPPLPDLVVPRKGKHISTRFRFSSKQAFKLKLRALKEAYGQDLIGWYRQNYQNKILDAFLNAINAELNNLGYFDEVKPEVNNRFFSKEQMEEFRDINISDTSTRTIYDFMKAYNQLRALPTYQFMDMYDKGYLPAFKFIYADMTQGTYTGLEQLVDGMRSYRRIFSEPAVASTRGR